MDGLLEETDYAAFNGDCGTKEDIEELEEFLNDQDLDGEVVVPGNSDASAGYVDYGAVDDLSRVEENTRTLEIEAGERTYEMLLSHIPQNIGIRKGSDERRETYLGDENERGVPLAEEGSHQINATAHYHGEGSWVMDDGKLTVQLGAIGDTYITDEDLPETSVQLLEFVEDKVRVKHIDFRSLETVEERVYRFNGQGFEEVSVDSPWEFDQRYS